MNEKPQKAKVFEETYQDYLKQLAAVDYLARADILGARTSGQELIIEFYGPYGSADQGIPRTGGRPC